MSPAGNGEGAEPGDGIATRSASRDGTLEWVLVDGSRLVLTAGFSVGVFLALLVCHRLGVVGFGNGSSVSRMGSGMVAGSFSLVTLVVSVNQLILSQEFSLAGEFRDRLDGVAGFRRDIEDATGVPATPAAPTGLLELLSAHVRDRASALADAADEHRDGSPGNRTALYARGVIVATRKLDDSLEGADATAFDALVAAVAYDDIWQRYAARHLRNDDPEPAAETRRALDELIDALRLFTTAQAHFKTIYLQRELARFSQLTVAFGVPAVAAAALVTLLYGGPGGQTLPSIYYPYVIPLLVAVVSVPIGLLTAYVLRTATLTRQTAATGPTLLRTDPDGGPFDISYGDDE